MAGVKGRSGGMNARTMQEHRLHGTLRRARHAGFSSPEVPKGRPTPPKPLEGDALAEWDRMCTSLEHAGSLALTDGPALYQYCKLFAETEAAAERPGEYRAAIERLEGHLLDLEPRNRLAVLREIGKLHALLGQNSTRVRQGRMALRVYLVEFGMTPASRGRVKLAEPTAEDSFAEFLR